MASEARRQLYEALMAHKVDLEIERGFADQPAVHHRGLPGPGETTGDTAGDPPDGRTVPAPRATAGAAA